jgi:hypothetical protein
VIDEKAKFLISWDPERLLSWSRLNRVNAWLFLFIVRGVGIGHEVVIIAVTRFGVNSQHLEIPIENTVHPRPERFDQSQYANGDSRRLVKRQLVW